MPRSRSTFIQSERARRWSPRAFTAPASWIAPPNSSSFSVRVVLPASGCEMMANVRRLSMCSFTGDSEGWGWAQAARAVESSEESDELFHLSVAQLFVRHFGVERGVFMTAARHEAHHVLELGHGPVVQVRSRARDVAQRRRLERGPLGRVLGDFLPADVDRAELLALDARADVMVGAVLHDICVREVGRRMA